MTGGSATDAEAASDDAAEAAVAADTAAAADATIDQPYFQFLVPTPSAATMAFLGAYFFGLYTILRSYFRGDLRPKLYNQITARLVTVVVLAYLINTLFYEVEGRNTGVWVLSFLAGVVPSTVLRRVGRMSSSLIGGVKGRATWVERAFDDVMPSTRALTELDGVDIYDTTRLEAEGINNVAALARSDLVSLMVSTRVPIDRLVDWTDQAVLILLLEADAVDDGKNERRVVLLRRLGIRTASGIVAVNDEPCDPKLKDAVQKILRGSGDDGTTLCALAGEIKREPAMGRILQWYRSEHGDVQSKYRTIRVPPRPPAAGPTHANGDGDGDHPAGVAGESSH